MIVFKKHMGECVIVFFRWVSLGAPFFWFLLYVFLLGRESLGQMGEKGYTNF